MRLAVIAAWALLLLLPGVGAAHAEKRVALVIGNGDYQHADKLANPVTDARRVREALAKLGFEIVYGENLDQQSLRRTIGRFADVAHESDVALVFFAGHGATFSDIPYVVPVDAEFSSLGQVPYELVPVETLLGELRRAKGVRIAILDACRDDAAERELKRVATRGGEITRGLARVKNPDGLILAYATQYLATAADGDPNGDSPFTSALLNHIATPGLDVKELFFRVGSEVIARTKGRQRPEISVSFYDSYALVPPSVVAPGTSVAVSPQEQAEHAWAATKDTTSRAVLQDFIRQFADTPYGSMARARLDELNKSQIAAAVEDPAAKAWVETRNTTSTKVLEDFIRTFGDSTAYGRLATARLNELKSDKARAAIVANRVALFDSPREVVIGNRQGKVTIVEFFDYNDAFSKRALADMLELLKTNPDLKFVLKEFPVLGPGSVEASQVGVAVRMQDESGRKYLDFHQRLLRGPGVADKAHALVAARLAGLDVARIERDMKSDEVRRTLEENMKLAEALELVGTPSYVIGTQVVVGAIGLEALQRQLAGLR